MNIFLLILLATFVSGVLALVGGLALLWKADLVRKFSVHFVSFAVGALLATSFLDLLPEALEMGEGRPPHSLFLFCLIGIVGFFILESLILKFHHYHAEEGGDHHHAAPILLLVGDSVHNFIDGVVIAVAFMTSVPLGVVTALAVAAHELPQEISDFSVMLYHGWTKRKVLWANIFSSLTAVVGGVIAYLSRDFIEPYLPQLLALTAGIFIYIATANLIPELSPHHKSDKTWHILALMVLGIVAVRLLGFHLE